VRVNGEELTRTDLSKRKLNFVLFGARTNTHTSAKTEDPFSGTCLGFNTATRGEPLGVKD
jgi:hypothetical protein